MPRFSERSLQRLATCDERLQALLHEAILENDFSVLCGHRGKTAQNLAVRKGRSKSPWPKSRHNSTPSQAVDVAPYPIDWQNLERFKDLGALVQAKAKEMGIQVTWGGDWGWDWGHYQIEGGELTQAWRARLQQHLDSYEPTPSQAPEPTRPDLAYRLGISVPADAIPQELVEAIIQVESGGDQHAMRFEPGFLTRYLLNKDGTPKPVETFGACSADTERIARATSWGPMQVMGQVAREYGYEKPFLSELCGPDGVEVGKKVLLRLKGRFLDTHGWQAVVAAYNGGPGAVQGVNEFTNHGYVVKVLQALGGRWPEERQS